MPAETVAFHIRAALTNRFTWTKPDSMTTGEGRLLAYHKKVFKQHW